MDLARSVQEVIELALLNLAKHAKAATGSDFLCLAGGVALNCVANGKLLRENLFKDIWIQPAAGDAGGALGAALAVWHEYAGNPRSADGVHDRQKGSFLGPEFTDLEIREFLNSHKIPHSVLDDAALIETTAKLLADEKVVGWFEGRMEFGPRALGARSILGDARSAKMQKMMNLKIKYRESFRPFAPAVMDSETSRYFELDRPSPYMLLVADVRKELRSAVKERKESLWGIELLNTVRSKIPAVTHVDYSARIQTVHPDTNPKFYGLLREFQKLTQCPVLVNTSFNVRGEPLVCRPVEAYKCFMRTEMDALVLGNCLLHKADQPKLVEDVDWREQFQLD
jgi:carbamoyltransferase